MSKDQKVKNSDKTESNGAGFDKTGSSVLSENVASFSPPPFSGASNGVGLLQKKENSDSITEGSAQQNEHIVAPPPFSPTSSGLGTAQKKESNETGMNDGVKQKMESSFGTDFSDVNIHTNSNSAEGLGALAYTQGTDIHFASGQFNQNSNQGQQLLGHELSHVVQQKQGRVSATHQEKGFGINDSHALESEADKHGKVAASGGKIGATTQLKTANNSSGYVQKKNAPIQMWRNMPGQARIERTEPNTRLAWNVFVSACRGVAGHAGGKCAEEMRSPIYEQIANALDSGRGTISVNLPTYYLANQRWTGTIEVVIDNPTEIAGGGNATTSMGSGGSTASGNTGGTSGTGTTSGSATASSSPGSAGGTGGSATGAVGSSSTTTNGNSRAYTGANTSSSSISQNMKRFRASMGVRVHLSATSALGDESGWDYVNPFALASHAGAALGKNDFADRSGACGTIYYFQGDGIAPPAATTP